MQSGSASDMVFDIADQIAYLSQHTRLEPGDLICSGSPAGFGSHHGRYLRPGDIVEAGVEGLGTQRVHCIS
jgi:2,4-diketo-3-deoxy-L-fuconate hydrolase